LIDLSTRSSTSSLTFHLAQNVTITHIALQTAELKSTTSQSLPLDSLTFDEDKERVTVDLKQIPGEGLKAGSEAKLWVRFESELTGSMAGYYRSEGETGDDGKKPVYALTQFEATAARKAFP
jgi:aminopeptidase 2